MISKSLATMGARLVVLMAQPGRAESEIKKINMAPRQRDTESLSEKYSVIY